VASTQELRGVFPCLTKTVGSEPLDVFGPTVEFLTLPNEDDNAICVMRGVVPPGVTVPLHSHDDFEGFFIVSGTQQVLVQGVQGLQWVDARAGDYVQIPGGIPHAHRNIGDVPAVDLIITTARLGKFLREIGRPVAAAPEPPKPQEVARFVEVAAKYGYWLGTAEENAAVGIDVPKFVG
jgi:quercetin dioxygenase-like cupin family protein